MAGTPEEQFKSRRSTYAGRNSTVERIYLIDECADEAEALETALLETPASFAVAGWLLTEKTADAEFVGPSESGTDDEYRVTVTWKSVENSKEKNDNQPPGGYGSPTDPEDDPTYHISFGTTRGKVYEALAQSLMVAGSPTASDVGLRLHDDGTNVNGLDIPVPTGRHTERRCYPFATITPEWIRNRQKLMRTTNSTTQGPYAAGELFFDEINIQYRSDGNVDVDFGFEFSENVADYTFAGQTFAKKGHEYVWARYTPIVTDGKVIMTPTHVYLAKIWPENDWATLFDDPPEE